jgi:tyrosyl-tRNA synthetase
MSENIKPLEVEAIVHRQFESIRKEFKEQFKEGFAETNLQIKDLTSVSHENALSIKELVGAISESSLESRYTREDVEKLSIKLDGYMKTNDAKIEILTTESNKKKANQWLIITIGGAILSALGAISGFIFGKS